MCLATNNDITFLCEATALPYGKLLSLIEEDFDLIVDTIAEKEFSTTPISLSLFAKLSIFRASRGNDFSLADKSYVADCISTYYPKIYKRSHYLIDQKQLGETQGQLYLVLAGLLPQFILEKNKKNGAPSLDFYISAAQKAFINVDRISLAERIYDWVLLLNKLKWK